ncbi:hypothetical protein GOB94_02140 [Granulicella sp. 5B5]|uniref:hypothetical protein n=1 Tax=Granulicella sp. 5B5 TaxID=1617967 RepID=UPI0015F566AD|nr:hypothetical protein [Granulicella sp. 5B5]QMV17635.1 hypothetical protein GOB94_02140 [Granulicella sp. 5B5]
MERGTTLVGMQTCAPDPMLPEVFVLRDVRERQMMADPSMKQRKDRISVALSVWACMDHCRLGVR